MGLDPVPEARATPPVGSPAPARLMSRVSRFEEARAFCCSSALWEINQVALTLLLKSCTAPPTTSKPKVKETSISTNVKPRLEDVEKRIIYSSSIVYRYCHSLCWPKSKSRVALAAHPDVRDFCA